MGSFPNIPNKRITGNLQLTVRPPGVSLDVQDKDIVGTFKPPAGFSVQETMGQVLDKRIESCKKSLLEIRDKKKTCISCKGLSEKHESSCLDILKAIRRVGSMSDDKIGLVFGQNLDGNITLDLIYSHKMCTIIIYEETFSVGMYSNDSLVTEELMVPTTDCYKFLMFLMDTEI